jgi:hypothetical protein
MHGATNSGLGEGGVTTSETKKIKLYVFQHSITNRNDTPIALA